MSKGSPIRQMKRKAMRDQGVSFKDRVMESIRMKMPIRKVEFNFQGSNLKVKKA